MIEHDEMIPRAMSRHRGEYKRKKTRFVIYHQFVFVHQVKSPPLRQSLNLQTTASVWMQSLQSQPLPHPPHSSLTLSTRGFQPTIRIRRHIHTMFILSHVVKEFLIIPVVVAQIDTRDISWGLRSCAHVCTSRSGGRRENIRRLTSRLVDGPPESGYVDRGISSWGAGR